MAARAEFPDGTVFDVWAGDPDHGMAHRGAYLEQENAMTWAMHYVMDDYTSVMVTARQNTRRAANSGVIVKLFGPDAWTRGVFYELETPNPRFHNQRWRMLPLSKKGKR